ncbi:hypothetical protein [Marinactinospora rubrisoli]|uniref:Uncharacterized protein n=1 Tax=Marinactinospora rubrisoli TaxID=2715399 RepID=A0ABW2KN90_9ACTN
MGAWRAQPAAWPLGVPPAADPGFPSRARHWLAEHAVPWWLAAALPEDVPPRAAGRLGRRMLAARHAGLAHAQQRLEAELRLDGLSPAEAREAAAAAAAHRRRLATRLTELDTLGRHLPSR